MKAHLGIEIRRLRSAADIAAARRLQLRRYRDLGYVKETGLEGLPADPYVPISTYFGAFDEDDVLVGVSRLIHVENDFCPALADLQLGPHAEDILDDRRGLGIDEVSALAVEPLGAATADVANGLYREMMRHSLLVDDHKIWVFAVDHKVKRILEYTLKLRLKSLGPVQDYMGSPTEPVLMSIFECLASLRDKAPARFEYYVGNLEIDLRDETQVVRLTEDPLGRSA